jgi:hypothetical protein
MRPTYKSQGIDLQGLMNLQRGICARHCNRNNLDNFLLTFFPGVRFRADDSLCEFLKKPVCKNLT